MGLSVFAFYMALFYGASADPDMVPRATNNHRENQQDAVQAAPVPKPWISKAKAFDKQGNANHDASTSVPLQKESTQESNVAQVKQFLETYSSDIARTVYLLEKFTAEVVDYQWVDGAEKEIASAFYDGDGLAGFEPQAIQCKASLCQVKMQLEPPEKNTQLVNLLGNKFLSGKLHFAFAIIAVHSVEGYQFLYFIK